MTLAGKPLPVSAARLDASLFEIRGPRERQRAATRERIFDAALAEARIAAEESVGDAVWFREMLSLFARRPPELDLEAPAPVLEAMYERFAVTRDRNELRSGLDPEQAARPRLSGVLGHGLGVEATPDERRKELRALFGLYLQDAAV